MSTGLSRAGSNFPLIEFIGACNGHVTDILIYSVHCAGEKPV